MPPWCWYRVHEHLLLSLLYDAGRDDLHKYRGHTQLRRSASLLQLLHGKLTLMRFVSCCSPDQHEQTRFLHGRRRLFSQTIGKPFPTGRYKAASLSPTSSSSSSIPSTSSSPDKHPQSLSHSTICEQPTVSTVRPGKSSILLLFVPCLLPPGSIPASTPLLTPQSLLGYTTP